jgi:hypothetical protein
MPRVGHLKIFLALSEKFLDNREADSGLKK